MLNFNFILPDRKPTQSKRKERTILDSVQPQNSACRRSRRVYVYDIKSYSEYSSAPHRDRLIKPHMLNTKSSHDNNPMSTWRKASIAQAQPCTQQSHISHLIMAQLTRYMTGPCKVIVHSPSPSIYPCKPSAYFCLCDHLSKRASHKYFLQAFGILMEGPLLHLFSTRCHTYKSVSCSQNLNIINT